MPDYHIFWGESHDNTYQFADPPAPIEECLARAAAHLDFYAAAYYTTCSPAFEPGGHLSESTRPHKVPVEVWKDDERLDREWAEVKAACREADQPGRFVTFPGYEWQGDATGGDHNVSSPDDDLPIFRVATLRELYDRLRGLRAVAIPHHTAYRPGCRGRDWSVYDERLSPYTEIYSVHGCSETDEEWVGMRQNSHMGPPVAELAAGSREMLYVDDSRVMLRDAFGIDPDGLQRWDTVHHIAYKVKVHRPMPEAAWTAVYELEDDEPLTAETHYRVRVEQRNGQRAWSSPIWVTPAAR